MNRSRRMFAVMIMVASAMVTKTNQAQAQEEATVLCQIGCTLSYYYCLAQGGGQLGCEQALQQCQMNCNEK